MVIKYIVIKAVKNLVAMLLSKTMIFWVLERAAKCSETTLDDNSVKLVKAAYDNDQEAVKAAAEAILAEFNKGDE